MTGSSRLSSLERHGLKEPAWADLFLQGARCPGGLGEEEYTMCCVSSLFVERLTSYPDKDWVQTYRVLPVPQAHSVSTIVGLLWQSVSRSVVSNSATPWTVAHQAPLSMEFSKQEYWSG